MVPESAKVLFLQNLDVLLCIEVSFNPMQPTKPHRRDAPPHINLSPTVLHLRIHILGQEFFVWTPPAILNSIGTKKGEFRLVAEYHFPPVAARPVLIRKCEHLALLDVDFPKEKCPAVSSTIKTHFLKLSADSAI